MTKRVATAYLGALPFTETTCVTQPIIAINIKTTSINKNCWECWTREKQTLHLRDSKQKLFGMLYRRWRGNVKNSKLLLAQRGSKRKLVRRAG